MYSIRELLDAFLPFPIFVSFSCGYGGKWITSHIVRKGTPVLSSFGRAIDLLQIVVRDRGRHPVKQLVEDLDMPDATMYRLLATLRDQGLLQLAHRGHYVAGPQLLCLNSYLQPSRIFAELARKRLTDLSFACGSIVHLGMFEDDMVTYLVKEGPDKGALFTREGMQLEAYCTGIGKVLLADLPPRQQAKYLASGPFVSLTPKTNVDVSKLRRELAEVKIQGFAIDNREISPNLSCIAVPVPSGNAPLSLGMSVSRLDSDNDPSEETELIALMRDAARDIGEMMVRKMVGSLPSLE